MGIRIDGKFTTLSLSFETKRKLQQISYDDRVPIYEVIDRLATEELGRRSGDGQSALLGTPTRRPQRDNEELEAAVLRLAIKLVGVVGIKFPPLPGVSDEDLNEVSRSVDTLRQTLHSKQLPGLSPGSEVIR